MLLLACLMLILVCGRHLQHVCVDMLSWPLLRSPRRTRTAHEVGSHVDLELPPVAVALGDRVVVDCRSGGEPSSGEQRARWVVGRSMSPDEGGRSAAGGHGYLGRLQPTRPPCRSQW